MEDESRGRSVLRDRKPGFGIDCSATVVDLESAVAGKRILAFHNRLRWKLESERCFSAVERSADGRRKGARPPGLPLLRLRDAPLSRWSRPIAPAISVREIPSTAGLSFPPFLHLFVQPRKAD
nr:hypothetical protein CFP56_11424 [Quercus suber]